MICSNKAADLLKALCAAAVILFAVNACTDVDDGLGGNLLPNNQKMTLRIDTIGGNGIKTYLYKADSLRSSKLGYAYFGQEYTKAFGARKNSFIAQFIPIGLPYEDGFGLDPIVDSMMIVLPLYSFHGDTTKTQKFDIYEIKWDDDEKAISADSVYYISFPVEEYLGNKLFTFEHTGGDVIAKLEPVKPHGEDYLKRLVTYELVDTYNDYELFLKEYKGLYITPSDPTPETEEGSAAVYATSLEDAYLMIYVRNHDTVDISAINDTVRAPYVFYDQADLGNTSINIVDFDYSKSEKLAALDLATNGFTDTIGMAQEKMYIQSMGGVTGLLRFSDEIIENLQSLKTQKDENGETVEYTNIMINQAEMYIWLDTNTTDEINKSMTRMGSYLNLNKLSGIPDYLYYYEKNEQTRSSGDPDYMLPYNGYLNRSNGYYKLDITSYVQQLAKPVAEGEDPVISPVVHLAPDAYAFYSFGESIIKGAGSENPIKIRLTYTLIDRRD